MENIRTLQQSILWVAENNYEIVAIVKNIVNYGPIRIAMVLKNNV